MEVQPIHNDVLVRAIKGGEPCGEDPRYLDAFETIKIELDKLAGTDFSLIKTQAELILENHSKDLRVAGFYLLAKTYLQGIKGAIEALTVYCELVECFANTLFPQREKARLAAIRWLNEPRMLAFISQHELALCQTTKTQLITLITRLNQAISSQLGEQFEHFSVWNKWLKSHHFETKKPTVIENVKQSFLPSKPSAMTPLSVIEDDKSASTQGLALVRFYLDEKKYDKALVISRALRWQGLALPKRIKFITQVPPPRKEAREQLLKAIESESPMKIFKRCERFFLEAGSHFWLTLQYHAYQALKEANESVLANILSAQMTLWLSEVPELSNLYYNDKTPFACEETKEWFADLLKPTPAQTVTSPAGPSLDLDAKTLIEQAKKVTGKNELAQQIAFIQSKSMSSELAQLEQAYAVALLSKQQSVEIALTLFKQLYQRIEASQAALWQPALVVTIWSEHFSLLKRSKQVEPDLLSSLKEKMCQTDLQLALRLLS